MESILEYIMLNYTWFLGGAIIILLAIIGSYADKTNFGQGKGKEEKIETKEEKFESNKSLNLKENLKEESLKVETEEPISTQSEETVEVIQNEEKTEEIAKPLEHIVQKESFEEKFEKFDQEFNELLPKKEIVDGELLDEIESLSLDKTQKIKLTDIPDLDDVELPKIKSLEPEDDDIWKF